MKIYYVDESYINSLRRIDGKVLFNKSTRPYLGIVLTVNNLNYFVPLSSPKENKKISNQLVVKMFEVNNIENKLGYLLFLNMIPVPNRYLTEVDMEQIKIQDSDYYQLLVKQLIFIRQEEERILSKAQKVYRNAVINQVPFISEICVDFRALETYAMRFNS